MPQVTTRQRGSAQSSVTLPACTPVLARTIQGMLWVLRLFPVPVGPEADNPTMFQLLSLPRLQLTGYNC